MRLTKDMRSNILRKAIANVPTVDYMAKLKAFVLGMREFRTSWTTHLEDEALMEAYDAGRDFAHRITFRLYEER